MRAPSGCHSRCSVLYICVFVCYANAVEPHGNNTTASVCFGLSFRKTPSECHMAFAIVIYWFAREACPHRSVYKQKNNNPERRQQHDICVYVTSTYIIPERTADSKAFSFAESTQRKSIFIWLQSIWTHSCIRALILFIFLGTHFVHFAETFDDKTQIVKRNCTLLRARHTCHSLIRGPTTYFV